MAFLNNVYQEINDDQLVTGIFIDITKAFDMVDHKLLLEKLFEAGIRGHINEWFGSYLNNRSQKVKIFDVFSMGSRY